MDSRIERTISGLRSGLASFSSATIPVNTGGGLKARGHPPGATGVAQAVEIVQQLRGTAGERQVKGATLGLLENHGGTGATAVVHLLEMN